MGGLSVWHWLIFLAVALLLFGGSGKISSIMGDVAKGIKSFKKGMSEDDTASPAPPAADPFKRDEPRAIDSPAARPADSTPAQQRSTSS
jgi:sec-independent protein translocase protein TatA